MRGVRMGSVLLLTMLLGVIGFGGTAFAAGPIELYTPLTHITASPGQNINYAVDVINNTEEIQRVGVRVSNMPDGWEYTLKSSGFGITEISVMPGDQQEVQLGLEVPFAIQEGLYRFSLDTDKGVSLPLTINIDETSTFRTELTTDQPNLEGASDASFTYTVKLENKTAEKQTYALRHGAPPGWDVAFVSSGKNVSSVVAEPNTSESITVNVTPATLVRADTYKIPIEAANASTGASVELEAVITGTYALDLTTDNELLSTELTAGKSKKINLVLKNTGTSELRDIKLSSSRPSGWEITFEQDEKIHIPAGDSTTIAATITSSSKAIAGDYVAAITASNPEVSESASFRIAVKTSVLWGWLGILIIVGVFGGIFYLFRKYGRR